MDNNVVTGSGFRPSRYQIGVIGQDVRASVQRGKHGVAKEIVLEKDKVYTVDAGFYDWLKAQYPDNICNLNYKPTYLLVKAVCEGELH